MGGVGGVGGAEERGLGEIRSQLVGGRGGWGEGGSKPPSFIT